MRMMKKNFLLILLMKFSSFKNHITFNGLAFDIGFINYRLKKHNIDFSLNKEDNFDIFKFVKSFKQYL